MKWLHGMNMDSWYEHGIMVLTIPMVLTQTHGIVSVLLNHTRTRGLSVTRIRDFFLLLLGKDIISLIGVSLFEE